MFGTRSRALSSCRDEVEGWNSHPSVAHFCGSLLEILSILGKEYCEGKRSLVISFSSPGEEKIERLTEKCVGEHAVRKPNILLLDQRDFAEGAIGVNEMIIQRDPDITICTSTLEISLEGYFHSRYIISGADNNLFNSLRKTPRPSLITYTKLSPRINVACPSGGDKGYDKTPLITPEDTPSTTPRITPQGSIISPKNHSTLRLPRLSILKNNVKTRGFIPSKGIHIPEEKTPRLSRENSLQLAVSFSIPISHRPNSISSQSSSRGGSRRESQLAFPTSNLRIKGLREMSGGQIYIFIAAEQIGNKHEQYISRLSELIRLSDIPVVPLPKRLCLPGVHRPRFRITEAVMQFFQNSRNLEHSSGGKDIPKRIAIEKIRDDSEVYSEWQSLNHGSKESPKRGRDIPASQFHIMNVIKGYRDPSGLTAFSHESMDELVKLMIEDICSNIQIIVIMADNDRARRTIKILENLFSEGDPEEIPTTFNIQGSGFSDGKPLFGVDSGYMSSKSALDMKIPFKTGRFFSLIPKGFQSEDIDEVISSSPDGIFITEDALVDWKSLEPLKVYQRRTFYIVGDPLRCTAEHLVMAAEGAAKYLHDRSSRGFIHYYNEPRPLEFPKLPIDTEEIRSKIEELEAAGEYNKKGITGLGSSTGTLIDNIFWDEDFETHFGYSEGPDGEMREEEIRKLKRDGYIVSLLQCQSQICSSLNSHDSVFCSELAKKGIRVLNIVVKK